MATTGKLRIPEGIYPGLGRLLKISDEEYREIEQSLEEATPTLSDFRLASFVAERTKLNKDDVGNIITALLSLHVGWTYSKTEKREFIERVCEALLATNKDDLRPDGGNWEPFKERLNRLLRFEQLLGITSKAYRVMSEHPHVYRNIGTRVLTDVRPVFPNNLEEPLSAAVIVHTLKIAYREGSTHKEFFVAMDNNDVHELRELLDRADKKAAKLREVLLAAQLAYLDPEAD